VFFVLLCEDLGVLLGLSQMNVAFIFITICFTVYLFLASWFVKRIVPFNKPIRKKDKKPNKSSMN
jgi:hypothetical protein